MTGACTLQKWLLPQFCIPCHMSNWECLILRCDIEPGDCVHSNGQPKRWEDFTDELAYGGVTLHDKLDVWTTCANLEEIGAFVHNL